MKKYEVKDLGASCSNYAFKFWIHARPMEDLVAWAVEKGVGFARVHGIGAIKNVDLAYFDPKSKQYARRIFPEQYELANAEGNISLLNGSPFLHLHLTMTSTDGQYTTYSGHVFDFEVAVTAEIFVGAFEKTNVQRKLLAEACPYLPTWDLMD